MGWIAEQAAALGGDDFPAAVLALVSLMTLAVLAWALLVAVLASTPTLRSLAVALTPRVMRGVVLAGVAGTLTVPGAHADDRGVDGLRLPDRPMVATATQPAPHRTVNVRRGDTLWAIARSHLGPRADVVATARACDRWYEANRDVIGDDRDLIHPGQQLTAPSEDRS
ncbi:LysM peptidoglycan-binding domain-containing protein [Aeromicrobium sp.]|uniref:LysM peptidoglycan-binding domain-containing protein n=1 Tax=Aeromicrobium sp. TaxID=1871063 RepID=UPI003C6151AE